MIKKYCLRNYLDNYKEVINDFTVNFDHLKKVDPNKTQKKPSKIVKESDTESEIEFISKLKAFRDHESPKYILPYILLSISKNNTI